MLKDIRNIIILGSFLLLWGTSNTQAAVITLASPTVLGNLELSDSQLKSIKEAMDEALKGPIDAQYQCGEVRLDCVVRAAREWKYQGSTYREIVVNIHTVGHASVTAEKSQGKWTEIKIK
jgi:hypothetical protein